MSLWKLQCVAVCPTVPPCSHTFLPVDVHWNDTLVWYKASGFCYQYFSINTGSSLGILSNRWGRYQGGPTKGPESGLGRQLSCSTCQFSCTQNTTASSPELHCLAHPKPQTAKGQSQIFYSHVLQSSSPSGHRLLRGYIMCISLSHPCYHSTGRVCPLSHSHEFRSGSSTYHHQYHLYCALSI